MPSSWQESAIGYEKYGQPIHERKNSWEGFFFGEGEMGQVPTGFHAA